MDVDVWSITWQTTVAGNISFQPCPSSLGRYMYRYNYVVKQISFQLKLL